jgi:hypothetical protein
MISLDYFHSLSYNSQRKINQSDASLRVQNLRKTRTVRSY